jgi:hypothetical protein
MAMVDTRALIGLLTIVIGTAAIGGSCGGAAQTPAPTPVAGSTVGDGFSVLVPSGFVGDADNGKAFNGAYGQIVSWFWSDPLAFPPRYVSVQPVKSTVGPAASLAAAGADGQTSPVPLPSGEDVRILALPAGNATTFVQRMSGGMRLRSWYFDGPDGRVWVLRAQNLDPVEEDAFVLSLRWLPTPSPAPD